MHRLMLTRLARELILCGAGLKRLDLLVPKRNGCIANADRAVCDVYGIVAVALHVERTRYRFALSIALIELSLQRAIGVVTHTPEQQFLRSVDGAVTLAHVACHLIQVVVITGVAVLLVILAPIGLVRVRIARSTVVHHDSTVRGRQRDHAVLAASKNIASVVAVVAAGICHPFVHGRRLGTCQADSVKANGVIPALRDIEIQATHLSIGESVLFAPAATTNQQAKFSRLGFDADIAKVDGLGTNRPDATGVINQAANVFRRTRFERCILGRLYRVCRVRAFNRHICLRPCRTQVSARGRRIARCRKIEREAAQIESGNRDRLRFVVVFRLIDKSNQAAGAQLGGVRFSRNGARELHVAHGDRRRAVAVDTTDGATNIRLGFVFFVIKRHVDVARKRAAVGKRQLLAR